MIGQHDNVPHCPHCRAVADGFATLDPREAIRIAEVRAALMMPS